MKILKKPKISPDQDATAPGAQEAAPKKKFFLVGASNNPSPTDQLNQLTLIETAQKMHDWGISCVPVTFKKKAPSLNGWQSMKIDPAEFAKHFSGQTNIGVLNGDPSGGLVDIDIDSEDCRPFLKWLPHTGMISGRDGNP